MHKMLTDASFKSQCSSKLESYRKHNNKYMSPVIIYKNGNTSVEINTKIGTRIINKPNSEPQKLEFPFSIDLSITSKCDKGCSFCYKSCNQSGKNGDLNIPFLNTLHKGTELAIGGGNPLEHPDLEQFLQNMNNRGVLASLTVNIDHFIQNKEKLLKWHDKNLIKGLGISVRENDILSDKYNEIPNEDFIVLHTILGLIPIEALLKIIDRKVLLLGYKELGRGKPKDVAEKANLSRKIHEIADYITRLIRIAKSLAFDNTALKQCHLTIDHLKRLGVEHLFNGHDFDLSSGSMYIDLAEDYYSNSSINTSIKIPLKEQTIEEIWKNLEIEVEKYNKNRKLTTSWTTI